MEELGSLWSYQENIDELKHKLLYTSIELESVKMEANEALKKHKEETKQLLNLLKVAYQERDDAKDQLQRLVNKLMPSSPTDHLQQPILHHHNNIQNESSPLVVLMPTTKANSSITESNSLSDTYHPQSHGSSPVDSFFDAVSSPDFSNINNMADSGNNMGFVNHHPFAQDYSGGGGSMLSTGMARADPGNAIIDSFVKGKNLPQKGKLLQTVMESGPLLQTLLVAGPLPRWRNPPPLQHFKIPPFFIKGCETIQSMNHNKPSTPNSISVPQKPLNPLSSPSPSPSSYLPVSRMSSQMCSISMLNFSSCPPSGSASQSNNGLMLTPSGAGKRQRFL
ncbi:hypothetical protein ACOSQ2_016861 [Xanthoceras sorbifolium]|uniref:TOX high mobility group box family member 4-A n=1 Tax=Xanthoceras sorbifolium TaxID=99658 RepID=A0ABQ8HIQ0_9ROSI|nr:hypothetical protein JRO89_XS10G0137200 [Xanthoceras sorbifolium]